MCQTWRARIFLKTTAKTYRSESALFYINNKNDVRVFIPDVNCGETTMKNTHQCFPQIRKQFVVVDERVTLEFGLLNKKL